MKKYVIKGGEEGKQRLNVLSRVMRPYTLELLKRAGIKEGMYCLDAGCGGGNVTLRLAKLVGARGKVVGIDNDKKIIELNKKDLKEIGLENIEYRHTDIFNLDEENNYHLIYARFLLSHLNSPEEALGRIIKALKPGGIMVVEDIEFKGHFSYPENKAFKRYVELYQEVVKRKGADPDIGPRLPGLLPKAGFKDIQMNVIHPTFMSGEGKLMAIITMEKIQYAVIKEKLASRDELKILLAELDEFTRDPLSIISLPRIFQVWGYKRLSS